MLANLIYKMTPVHKVVFAIVVSILGFLAVAMLSFSNMKVHNDISSLKELSLKVEIDILSLRRHEKDFIVRHDAEYLKKFEQRYQVLKLNLIELKSILKKLDITDIDFKEFILHLKKYQDYFFSLAKKDQKLYSQELQLSELEIQKLRTEVEISHNDGLHGAFRDSIHSAENILHKLQKVLKQEYEDISKYSIYKTIILSIMAVSIFLYLAVLIMKDIGGTLVIFRDELREFFKYLNNDSDKLILLTEDSGGTVGRISEDVNKYIKTTQKHLQDENAIRKEFIQVYDKIGQGDLSQRITLQSHNPDMQSLKDISNAMIDNLEKYIQRTLHVLNHYSKQEYNVDIDTENLEYDFKELAEGVNALKGSIVVLVKEGQENAEQLKLHSNNLSKHSKSIRQSTNNQNDSMNKSQDSVKDIIENIEQGNHSIKEMAELTSHLLTSVDEGLKLVSEADISMSMIDDQANEIRKTLAIIDEIALQTSILSLNASVEAVSAGEAGKGFAVVAREVRDLADKSTQAANQIKAIVQVTADKILLGQNVTSKLTKEFDDLSNYIHSTTNHINSLSNNSQKQNTLLENVNSAMPQLQKSIDNNMAVVKETDNVVMDIDNIVKTIVESTKKQVI